MSATIVSLIRTWTPVVVGSLVSWLLTLGIDLDPDAQAGLVVGLTGLLIAAYYGIVRVLERRWPWVGVLLGSTAQPDYAPLTSDERTDLGSLATALDPGDPGRDALERVLRR